MALCVLVEQGLYAGQAVTSSSGYQWAIWSGSQATLTAGNYSCPVGSHLLMTVAEINMMPKNGVPDAVLMRETFFLSFGLVFACYVLGKFSGAVLQLIRGNKNDY